MFGLNSCLVFIYNYSFNIDSYCSHALACFWLMTPPGHVVISPNSAELKALGPDFVFGFVQAVDGERDPRNLLLAFQIARNLIHRGYDFSEYSCGDTHFVVPSLIVSACNANV